MRTLASSAVKIVGHSATGSACARLPPMCRDYGWRDRPVCARRRHKPCDGSGSYRPQFRNASWLHRANLGSAFGDLTHFRNAGNVDQRVRLRQAQVDHRTECLAATYLQYPLFDCISSMACAADLATGIRGSRFHAADSVATRRADADLAIAARTRRGVIGVVYFRADAGERIANGIGDRGQRRDRSALAHPFMPYSVCSAGVHIWAS